MRDPHVSGSEAPVHGGPSPRNRGWEHHVVPTWRQRGGHAGCHASGHAGCHASGRWTRHAAERTGGLSRPGGHGYLRRGAALAAAARGGERRRREAASGGDVTAARLGGGTVARRLSGDARWRRRERNG
uniref:Uncharacterized protein n=1 Tax=Oryza sativa subsp. japonica TaxID=39947 RepID=Q6YWM6_ORYSJ|nr:hypothetical protein [Oryza sativa Japonica Group]BAD20165.1 hypothetical protein [Oryza sativa Japonica Group]